MKIEPMFVKPRWTRRLPPVDKGVPSRLQETLTQDNFLDEYYSSSHEINSVAYKSMRPQYEVDSTTGNLKIVGYEDVERVSWGMEIVAARILSTHAMGKDMWFGNEGDNAQSEFISLHKAHWTISGMTDALMSWFHDAGCVGDSAIYLYQERNKVKFNVFSYLKGDLIAKPNKNTFVRRYTLNGNSIVEMYTDKAVSVWVRDNAPESSEWDNIKLTYETSGKTLAKSEDGWICIKDTAHGLGMCPVCYLRFDDVFWGAGTSIRVRIEKLMSYWGDSNNYFGTPVFWFAGKPISLPAVGSAGKTIGFTSTDAKAGVIAPPDASTSFIGDIDKNFKMWCDTLGVVIIDPKDLKGGDYSGAYLRNLYFKSVQWAKLAIANIRPNIDEIIDIFDALVGKIEKKNLQMRSLKMSWIQEPFVPENKLEEITIYNQCVNSHTTSRETATEEIQHNNAREMERLRAQDLYELELNAKGIDLNEKAQETANEDVKAEPPTIEDHTDNKAKQGQV